MQELKLKLISKPKIDRIFITPLLLISLLLVQACGVRSQQKSGAVKDNTGPSISINSVPAGATVRANGRKIGITPMDIVLSSVLTPEWVSGENYGVDYRLKGDIIFEKDGCEDLSVPVSDTDLSTNINVTLNCKKVSQKTNTPEPRQVTTRDNLEQRLRKLEKLFKDGTISADEYKLHRTRILSEL
jgi:hypothetical protein